MPGGALLPWPGCWWKTYKCVYGFLCGFSLTDVGCLWRPSLFSLSVVRSAGLHSVHAVTFSFRTCRKHLGYPLVCFLGASSPWVSCFIHVVVAWYATSTPLCSWNCDTKWNRVPVACWHFTHCWSPCTWSRFDKVLDISVDKTCYYITFIMWPYKETLLIADNATLLIRFHPLFKGSHYK